MNAQQVQPTGSRVMTYARASTKKQKDSITDQQRLTRDHAQKNRDRIVYELSDIGSGRGIRRRPGYLEMKRLIKAHPKVIDKILVHEISRLGRSVRKLLELLELSEQHGIVIEDMRVGVVTHMLVVALGIVAQLQLDISVDQIKRAHISNVMEGLRAGGRIFGYKAVEANGEKGHLKLVPEEADVVRQIFRMAAEGVGLAAMARVLNFADKIPSPMGKRWRKSNFSAKQAVHGILHNPVYYGWVAYDRTSVSYDVETEAVRVTVNPQKQWRKHPGKHAPIIDKELFDRVQARFYRLDGEVVKPKIEERKNRGPAVLFSGQLKCPVCVEVDKEGVRRSGTMATCGADNGRMRIRCCENGVGACTNGRSFYRDQVQSTVLQGLLTELRKPEGIKAFLEEHVKARSEALSDRRQMKSRLTHRVERLEREVANLTKAIANGGPVEILNAAIISRNEEKTKALQDLERFVLESCDFEIDSAKVDEYIGILDDAAHRLIMRPRGDLDLELVARIETLIDKVYVHPNPAGKRGFEVEIFGKLANIVTGQMSFRQSFQKSFDLMHMHSGETIVIQRAAESLRFPSFRAQPVPKPRYIDQVLEVLTDSPVPLVGTAVVEKLAEHGIRRDVRAVTTLMSRNPETFMHIRMSGFMVRSTWEAMDRKWCPSTEEIVSYAHDAIVRAGHPLDLSQILSAISEAGFAIYGDPRRTLSAELSRNRQIFKNIHIQRGIWTVLTTTPSARGNYTNTPPNYRVA